MKENKILAKKIDPKELKKRVNKDSKKLTNTYTKFLNGKKLK